MEGLVSYEDGVGLEVLSKSTPVGASLLSIAVYQPPNEWLMYRYREQAHAYTGLFLANSILIELPAPPHPHS